jgi:hypothetical protein
MIQMGERLPSFLADCGITQNRQKWLEFGQKWLFLGCFWAVSVACKSFVSALLVCKSFVSTCGKRENEILFFGVNH